MNPMKMMGDADKLSIQQLQQSIQNGTIPAYIGVPLLQEKVKQQKAMQASMAAPQGPAKPPVAQQVMQEAQGVSALPSNLAPEGYADGGIVAFAGGQGSYVGSRTIAEQLEDLLGAQQAATYGEYGGTGWTPEEIAKYKQAGWQDSDIAKYKSPGQIKINNPSISKYPTIQVPEGGFNPQTNLPALYKQGNLAPAYAPKGGLPSVLPSPAAATAPVYKSGVPGVLDPWTGGLAEESKLMSGARDVLGKVKSAAGKVGTTIGNAASAAAVPLNVYGFGESLAADPRLLMAGAGNEKAKEAVRSGEARLPGVLEDVLTHGTASGPLFSAYRAVKDKFSTPSGYDAVVGADALNPKKPSDKWDLKTATPETQYTNAQDLQTEINLMRRAGQNAEADVLQAELDRQIKSGEIQGFPAGGSNKYGYTGTEYDPTTEAAPQRNASLLPESIGGIADLMQSSRYGAGDMDLAKAIESRRAAIGEDPAQKIMRDKLAAREERLATEEDRAPWMGLMSAGIGMMSGPSPFALVNAGQGFQQGLNTYFNLENKIDDKKDKIFDAQTKLAADKRAEDIAIANSGISSVEAKQAHNKTIDSQEAKLRQEYALKKAEIDAQDKYHTGYVNAITAKNSAALADSLKGEKLNTDQVIAALKDIQVRMADLDPESEEYKALAARQKAYSARLDEIAGVPVAEAPKSGGSLSEKPDASGVFDYFKRKD